MSVINDTCVTFQERLGLRVKLGSYFMNLIFPTATGASQAYLSATSGNLKLFLANFTLHRYLSLLL
jgi:hypothetical protein